MEMVPCKENDALIRTHAHVLALPLIILLSLLFSLVAQPRGECFGGLPGGGVGVGGRHPPLAAGEGGRQEGREGRRKEWKVKKGEKSWA
jgi:hypothetical protein